MSRGPGEGAAPAPLQGAHPPALIQVPPDGHLADAEAAGQVRDGHLAVFVQLFQEQLSTFLRKQSLSPFTVWQSNGHGFLKNLLQVSV